MLQAQYWFYSKIFQIDEDLRKIRKLLQPVDFTEEFLSFVHSDAVDTTWFTESLTAAGNLKENTFIWVNGGEGTGKTTLVLRAFKELSSSAFCSLFLCNPNAAVLTLHQIVRNIAFDLTKKFPDFRDYFLKFLDLDFGKLTFEEIFINVIEKGFAALDISNPLYFLIDSLDQFQTAENSGDDLARFLELLLRSATSKSVIVLVSGLLSSKLWHKFEPLDVNVLQIPNPETQNDIKTYIESCGHAIEPVHSKSDGIFLYARVACEYLYLFTDKNAADELRSRSTGECDRLPTGVLSLCHYIVQSIGEIFHYEEAIRRFLKLSHTQSQAEFLRNCILAFDSTKSIFLSSTRDSVSGDGEQILREQLGQSVLFIPLLSTPTLATFTNSGEHDDLLFEWDYAVELYEKRDLSIFPVFILEPGQKGFNSSDVALRSVRPKNSRHSFKQIWEILSAIQGIEVDFKDTDSVNNLVGAINSRLIHPATLQSSAKDIPDVFSLNQGRTTDNVTVRKSNSGTGVMSNFGRSVTSSLSAAGAQVSQSVKLLPERFNFKVKKFTYNLFIDQVKCVVESRLKRDVTCYEFIETMIRGENSPFLGMEASEIMLKVTPINSSKPTLGSRVLKNDRLADIMKNKELWVLAKHKFNIHIWEKIGEYYNLTIGFWPQDLTLENLKHAIEERIGPSNASKYVFRSTTMDSHMPFGTVLTDRQLLTELTNTRSNSNTKLWAVVQCTVAINIWQNFGNSLVLEVDLWPEMITLEYLKILSQSEMGIKQSNTSLRVTSPDAQLPLGEELKGSGLLFEQ
ncbi:hypothetical protein HK098_006617, partial [Nowakowskiella sp. JEL0407]